MKIIGSLYLNYVIQSKVTVKIIRADRWSENTVIAALQKYFLKSIYSGNSYFRFGSSTANQRTETWWSIMRRSRMDRCMNFFKDLRDEGDFDWSIGHHVYALRFFFHGFNLVGAGWNTRIVEQSPYQRSLTFWMSFSLFRRSLWLTLESRSPGIWFQCWCKRHWVSEIILPSYVKSWVLLGNVNFCIIAYV